MIRLHFTDADLRRVTVAQAPDALLETALSVRRLRGGTATGGPTRPALSQWHKAMQETRPRPGVLLDLVPRNGFLPDFLQQPTARDFATALDLVTATSAEQLALDLGLADTPGWNGSLEQPSRWARELANGSPAARRALQRDLQAYFTSTVAPLWPRVRTDAMADRAVRAEMLLRGGVDALLTTLSPTWSWQAPVLTLPSTSRHDIPLCGRGLLLVPSWFAVSALVMYRPEKPTVLVHPMLLAEEPAFSFDVLGPLLGRTRAAVLAVLRVPATTTELAERVGICLATASQHATVLRNAGLVDTARTGPSVLHSLTPLGLALLAGQEPSTPTH
ncbi:ArsR/SmtB family transcription factor [Streptomyces sp. NPDC056352]|uniref:ArsR/SmtB family transcription factor n=1 Tax=Streptomyces sp. NPDC056352 TaxID=3345791 RepID=UPI0035D900AF